MGARTLRVASLTLRIEADDEAWLNDVVPALLGPFLLPHNPPADTCLRVRCAPPAVELEGGQVIPVASPKALASVMEEQVWRALVDHTTDTVLLHAAGLAKNGRAVVLPAASQAGKSTLALALVARGCDYFSDDIVPVDLATGRAVPIPRLLHLRPPTLALLPNALEHVRIVPFPWSDAAARPVTLAAPRGAPDLAARLSIAAFVFPCRTQGDADRISALRPSLAAIQLMQHTLHRGALAATACTAMLDLARRIPCYRLAMRDVQAAAETLVGLLG